MFAASAFAAIQIKQELENSMLTGNGVLELYLKAYRNSFEKALLNALEEQQVGGIDEFKRSKEPTVAITEAVRGPDGRLTGAVTRRVPQSGS